MASVPGISLPVCGFVSRLVALSAFVYDMPALFHLVTSLSLLRGELESP